MAKDCKASNVSRASRDGLQPRNSAAWQGLRLQEKKTACGRPFPNQLIRLYIGMVDKDKARLNDDFVLSVLK
jgi:hypothetical protein